MSMYEERRRQEREEVKSAVKRYAMYGGLGAVAIVAMGIFFGSWYTEPIVGRVSGELRPSQLDQQIDDIVRFEKMLAHEGVLLLKF